MSFHVPNKYRVTKGDLASNASHGNNGAFIIRRLDKNTVFKVIASDGLFWEHVSVSKPDGLLPTWSDMCFIKDLFWDGEDCVVQYHPPKSEYVNNVHNCLHLWRPINQEIPRPPAIMVGIK